MAEYLLQMESRIQAAQVALESRIVAAQVALKNELQEAQVVLKNELQEAQVKSEERIHAHNQALTSALTYKVLFLGCGVAFGGVVIIEVILTGLGYELAAKKKKIDP